MANIIRCELPDGIKRYKPFTIEDYRDFLLVRNDLMNYDDEKQVQLVNELANDYFHELPPTWQQYAFLKVFTSSIGNTKIPISFECPTCGKKIPRIFNLSQDPLVNPSLDIDENTTLFFKFPEKDYEKDSEKLLESITHIIHHGNKYEWGDLSNETKTDIIDAIDFQAFETIIKKLSPINFTMTVKCCGKPTELIYKNLTSIFKFLVNPEEIFHFYEMNHLLVKNNYTNDAIMKMIPLERSMTLKLIEKDSADKK